MILKIGSTPQNYNARSERGKVAGDKAAAPKTSKTQNPETVTLSNRAVSVNQLESLSSSQKKSKVDFQYNKLFNNFKGRTDLSSEQKAEVLSNLKTLLKVFSQVKDETAVKTYGKMLVTLRFFEKNEIDEKTFFSKMNGFSKELILTSSGREAILEKLSKGGNAG